MNTSEAFKNMFCVVKFSVFELPQLRVSGCAKHDTTEELFNAKKKAELEFNVLLPQTFCVAIDSGTLIHM
jgi:hypothetical protein